MIVGGTVAQLLCSDLRLMAIKGVAARTLQYMIGSTEGWNSSRGFASSPLHADHRHQKPKKTNGQPHVATLGSNAQRCFREKAAGGEPAHCCNVPDHVWSSPDCTYFLYHSKGLGPRPSSERRRRGAAKEAITEAAGLPPQQRSLGNGDGAKANKDKDGEDGVGDGGRQPAQDQQEYKALAHAGQ